MHAWAISFLPAAIFDGVKEYAPLVKNAASRTSDTRSLRAGAGEASSQFWKRWLDANKPKSRHALSPAANLREVDVRAVFPIGLAYEADEVRAGVYRLRSTLSRGEVASSHADTSSKECGGVCDCATSDDHREPCREPAGGRHTTGHDKQPLS